VALSDLLPLFGPLGLRHSQFQLSLIPYSYHAFACAGPVPHVIFVEEACAHGMAMLGRHQVCGLGVAEARNWTA
jgi:hypothetical protein